MTNTHPHKQIRTYECQHTHTQILHMATMLSHGHTDAHKHRHRHQQIKQNQSCCFQLQRSPAVFSIYWSAVISAPLTFQTFYDEMCVCLVSVCLCLRVAAWERKEKRFWETGRVFVDILYSMTFRVCMCVCVIFGAQRQTGYMWKWKCRVLSKLHSGAAGRLLDTTGETDSGRLATPGPRLTSLLIHVCSHDMTHSTHHFAPPAIYCTSAHPHHRLFLCFIFPVKHLIWGCFFNFLQRLQTGQRKWFFILGLNCPDWTDTVSITNNHKAKIIQ